MKRGLSDTCPKNIYAKKGGKKRAHALPSPLIGSVTVMKTPGPPCPHPSDRTPPDATMKHVGAPSNLSVYLKKNYVHKL